MLHFNVSTHVPTKVSPAVEAAQAAAKDRLVAMMQASELRGSKDGIIKHSLFFKLPIELRLEVYRNLLYRGSIQSYVWNGRWSPNTKSRIVCLHKEMLQPSMLRVCRQTHLEASSVLYSDNKLNMICHSPGLPMWCPTTSPVPSTYLRLVSHISLNFYTNVRGPVLPSVNEVDALVVFLELARPRDLQLRLRRDPLWSLSNSRKFASQMHFFTSTLPQILKERELKNLDIIFEGFGDNEEEHYLRVPSHDFDTLRELVLKTQSMLVLQESNWIRGRSLGS